MRTPVLWELDVETNEATGVTHAFCSERCQHGFWISGGTAGPDVYLLKGDEPTLEWEDQPCDQCGAYIRFRLVPLPQILASLEPKDNA